MNLRKIVLLRVILKPYYAAGLEEFKAHYNVDNLKAIPFIVRAKAMIRDYEKEQRIM